MLLYAFWMMKFKDIKKVYIFTPHQIVQEQMSKLIEVYTPPLGHKLNVRSGANFLTTVEMETDPLIILDEGDDYTKNNALNFSDNKINGLAALRATKTVMVTATMDKFSKEVAEAIF